LSLFLLFVCLSVLLEKKIGRDLNKVADFEIKSANIEIKSADSEIKSANIVIKSADSEIVSRLRNKVSKLDVYSDVRRRGLNIHMKKKKDVFHHIPKILFFLLPF
jgi:hypothetical protein